jgi:3-keto-5-aminohexanoate cleavage enzyme
LRDERQPEPLIVTAAINGGEWMTSDTPYIPLTPEAIASATIEAADAGAAIAHIHVRAEDGEPSSDVSLYRRVSELIRTQSEVILNFSTDLRLPTGSDCLQLRPEMASLPMGSVNLGDATIAAPVPVLRDVAAEMKAAGVRPELEIFHEGMIGTARRLAADGVIEDPVVCQFCLGFDGGAPADPQNLSRMIDAIPRHWIWGVVGEGLNGTTMAALGMALGGHVRVGIEDHLYYLPGELALSNAQLVSRVVRLASEFGRRVATPTQAREIFGLRSDDPRVIRRPILSLSDGD